MTEENTITAEGKISSQFFLEQTEEGQLLRWGDSPETTFEIVCKADDAEQLNNFQELLTASYSKALDLLTLQNV